MKRKKWSTAEEKTLLTKYADLVNTGTLTKLKTREKKFRPVAEHVNSFHHQRDPNAFPFKWSWRDVSIKVQNMRHQYLGVKQKIRISDHHFNWSDGDNHWENFSNYKDVFGDVDLVNDGGNDTTGSSSSDDDDDDDDDLGLGLGFEVMEGGYRIRKRLGMVGEQILELRGVIGEMEDKRRRREFDWLEARREKLRMEEVRERWDEEDERRELEVEEREVEWEKGQFERWMRMEEEVERERERERRMEREEKREEEEMEWREKMLRLQIEHEKSMMRIYADACQNQMQIVGVFGRLICQLFGSANDGLGTAPPPHQALQNMPGDMDDDDDNVKPGNTSPSQFL